MARLDTRFNAVIDNYEKKFFEQYIRRVIADRNKKTQNVHEDRRVEESLNNLKSEGSIEP